MDLVWEGLTEAFRLILSGDREVISIMLLSLGVSGAATLLSLLLGIPLGTFLALSRFTGRKFVLGLLNTGMGMPPVVAGLFVSIMLWRSGPLGFLSLLYTPVAMMIAQFLLAFPIIAGFTVAGIGQINPRLHKQIIALGASRWQLLLMLLREARLPLMAAVMAGFGAVISEVGASMMVGGNIKGQTRVLTTATVLETSKGNFSLAIALGIILLVLVFAVNIILTSVQQRRKWEV